MHRLAHRFYEQKSMHRLFIDSMNPFSDPSALSGDIKDVIVSIGDAI
jgi:hypothetical protein